MNSYLFSAIKFQPVVHKKGNVSISKISDVRKVFLYKILTSENKLCPCQFGIKIRMGF